MSGDRGGRENFSDGALGAAVMADSGKVSVAEVAAEVFQVPEVAATGIRMAEVGEDAGDQSVVGDSAVQVVAEVVLLLEVSRLVSATGVVMADMVVVASLERLKYEDVSKRYCA